MRNDRNQLARRSAAAAVPQVTFTAADHDPHYTVSHTALGEFAVPWTADWLAGRFSVTDLPPEWVAFIQASIRGGWYESVYAGGPGAFSTVVWDLTHADEHVSAWVFSQVQLEAGELGGEFQRFVEEVCRGEMRGWVPSRKGLTFQEPLMLPDRETTTL